MSCGCGNGRHCERGWKLFREAEKLRDEATDDPRNGEKWQKALEAKRAYDEHAEAAEGAR